MRQPLWWASALSGAESYPKSEVRDSGPECQAEPAQERLGGATPRPRSVAAGRRHLVSDVRAAAGRSYPASEASGGCEETPHVRGEGHDPEEPPRARGLGRLPGGATRAAVAEQAQEGLEELSHAEDQERWR